MKKCTKCKQDKDEEDFAWRYKDKGIKSPICKSCQKEASDLWYLNNKEKQVANAKKNTFRYREESRKLIIEYLQANPCIDCGETDIVVLEFDHIDPEQKELNIARDYYLVSPEKLKEEIAKCQVRCANCHRRKTARDRGYYRLSPSNQISLLNC